ncbi:MAG: sigma-54-dependent Fis family transcriptional regulator [Myxococcales bacterium]|nr:sigma-54-dependent Fis family transcriptional regulator [Myxococcales bacterium]
MIRGTPPNRAAPARVLDADALLDEAALRRILALEVERSTRYDRPLTLARLRPGQQGLEALAEQARKAVRRVDAVARDDDGVWLVLPEVGATADVPVRRILLAMADGAAAGLARCPVDADTTTDLRRVAEEALGRATPGSLAWARGTDDRILVGGEAFLAADPLTQQVFRRVRELARSELPVLITGETGTGKEIVARALHHWSQRAEQPYLTVNCAALHPNLAESELFGYAKGAFSGAVTDKAGLFEEAHGGTLFVDEISEAPPGVQSKLLRALQAGEIRRVGEPRARTVDVRVVAAMNRLPADALAEGFLRPDLYYRLEVGRVVLPPLRERPGDVLALAHWYLRRARPAELPRQRLTPEVEAALVRHTWPGNVRELENLMRWTAQVIAEPEVRLAHLAERPWRPDDGAPVATPAESTGSFRPIHEELAALEARRMAEALAAADGNVSAAARLIEMPRRSFTHKMGQYGLQRHPRRPP